MSDDILLTAPFIPLVLTPVPLLSHPIPFRPNTRFTCDEVRKFPIYLDGAQHLAFAQKMGQQISAGLAGKPPPKPQPPKQQPQFEAPVEEL